MEKRAAGGGGKADAKGDHGKKESKGDKERCGKGTKEGAAETEANQLRKDAVVKAKTLRQLQRQWMDALKETAANLEYETANETMNEARRASSQESQNDF